MSEKNFSPLGISIKTILAGIMFILISLSITGEVSSSFPEDSAVYSPIHGRIVDILTGEPVVFANVYLSGTSLGTVSNSDGEFMIKIPKETENTTIVISSIGYRNKKLIIDQPDTGIILVKLEPVSIPIAEVTIINRDARELLITALDKIPDNYSPEPNMVTSFYRESIKKKRKYVSISEAVLDGYKASYTSLVDIDRVRIFKGLKSSNVKNMDTIVLKLQGGPHTMFQLDFVKNPAELLERLMMKYYLYEIHGVVNIDDRKAYVISFYQVPEIDVPLYEGKFYIGVTDQAFLGAEFRLSESRIDKASEYLVRKKPPGIEVDINEANYMINYRFINNKWHLGYVRSELVMVIKWEKRLFSSRYIVRSEMAVTDIDPKNINKYRTNETARRNDILIDQVSDFEDPDFWGDYNIIQPEESLQAAIDRMGRKLKRKQ